MLLDFVKAEVSVKYILNFFSNTTRNFLTKHTEETEIDLSYDE